METDKTASHSSGGEYSGSAMQPYRATQLWQELVVGFRSGMPRRKKRVKMHVYNDVFTGQEAVEWLQVHMQATGQFGAVSRQQVERLMQKFMDSLVLEEVKRKLTTFSEEEGLLYRFVTTPSFLNFIEDPSTPLGKRGRGARDLCFTNEYAFLRCENDGSSPVTTKRPCSSVAQKLAVFDTSQDKLPASTVASIWKELTLTRLLRLVELPSLDGVLTHDAVDGKQIQQNVHFIPKLLASIKRWHQPSSTHTPHHVVTDVPQWVVLAIRCLSKWPGGCTEELVGDMPVYCGFESDVLQSLVQYFTALPEPLISCKLFELHLSVLRLVRDKESGARDALQLCSLLLPQTNRMRLHRVLRLIYKAGENRELRLSRSQTNTEVLLSHFAAVVLRSSSKAKCSADERRDVTALVEFMAQNYKHIFKVPDDLKAQVQQKLQGISCGQDFDPDHCLKPYSCRVSQEQYEKDTRSASESAIAALLDKIIADQTMSAKEKKQKLKQFEKEYPQIYASRIPVSSKLHPSLPTSSKLHTSLV